ncbi:MAG: hypothetical protein KDD92_17685 [Caldilineaceae bacterium]|nr:hypothetical protein [Caldilineaceae bacterium]
MSRQSNQPPRYSLRQGVASIAPILLCSLLLLTGCTPSNLRKAAASGRDVVSALVPNPTPTDEQSAALIITPTPRPDEATPATAQANTAPVNTPIVSIPLGMSISTPRAQFSGMTWYGDQLILMPQYPQDMGNSIFALDKADISAYLRGETDAPLAPAPIILDDGALSFFLDGYQGFEAVAFDGDRAYLTIETNTPFGMMGVLVSGEMLLDGTLLQIDAFNQATIPAQANLSNMSDEALVLWDDQIVTFYEANGVNVNPQPQAHLFTKELAASGTMPFPTMEYRLTDASEIDDENRFWVINYMWPGDAQKLKPAADSLARPGESTERVERLVEYQFTQEGIVRTATPPIYLALLPGGISRNWEGLARFQDGELDGFLVVTDSFPTTQMAFVSK